MAVTLPDNNAVRLVARAGKLTVSTRNAEKGQTDIKLPAKGKARIAFDTRYLKDILARTSGQITLRTTDAQSPGVVKQNGTIHMVMPMFIEW